MARATSWRAWAMVKAGAFFMLEADVHQKEMGQEGLGRVMMPATPGTGLVMIHADFPLAFFKGGLDRPAHSAQTHELARRTSEGCIAQVVLDLRPGAQATPQDQPLPRTGQAGPAVDHFHEGKRSDHRPFGSFLQRPGVPARPYQGRSHVAHFLRRGHVRRQTWLEARASQWPTPRRLYGGLPQPDARISRNFGHVPFTQGDNSIQKGWIPAEMLIGGDPLKGEDVALSQPVSASPGPKPAQFGTGSRRGCRTDASVPDNRLQTRLPADKDGHPKTCSPAS